LKRFHLIFFKHPQQIKVDPLSENPPYSDELDYDDKRTKTLQDIDLLLRKLIDSAGQNGQLSLQDLKRISVVNDIAGQNVVSDINGEELNHRPRRTRFEKRPPYDPPPFVTPDYKIGSRKKQKKNKNGKSISKRVNKIAINQSADESMQQLHQLIESLERTQRITEAVLSHHLTSKSDINLIKKNIKNELFQAKNIHSSMGLNGATGQTYYLGMNLGDAIDRALLTSNEISSSNIEKRDDLIDIGDRLEDEIENAKELTTELADQIESKNDDRVEDEKELSNDDEEDSMVKSLEDAIITAKNANDKTLRKFAMKNKIRGQNVVANQNFREVNWRRMTKEKDFKDENSKKLDEADVKEPSERRLNYKSAEVNFPNGQPRHFWDENEKTEGKKKLTKKADKVGKDDKKMNQENPKPKDRKPKKPWKYPQYRGGLLSKLPPQLDEENSEAIPLRKNKFDNPSKIFVPEPNVNFDDKSGSAKPLKIIVPQMNLERNLQKESVKKDRPKKP
jgi:hypothetical protein